MQMHSRDQGRKRYLEACPKACGLPGCCGSIELCLTAGIISHRQSPVVHNPGFGFARQCSHRSPGAKLFGCSRSWSDCADNVLGGTCTLGGQLLTKQNSFQNESTQLLLVTQPIGHTALPEHVARHVRVGVRSGAVAAWVGGPSSEGVRMCVRRQVARG